MNVFVSDNSKSYDSITIECNCIAKCSYLRLINLKAKSDNHLYLDIITNNFDKKQLKRIHELEKHQIPPTTQLSILANLNKLYYLDGGISKIILYYNDITIAVHIYPESESFQFVFYNSHKDFVKDVSAYDISVSKTMLKKVIDTLDKWVNRQASNEHRV